MNWIITPNWITWCLLTIASLSLLGIVIYLWSRPKQNYNLTSTISWIALIVAVSAIVCAFTRETTPNDSTNLITVLGIMVTFLAGWQIISLINIGRIEDKLRKTEIQIYKNLGDICSDMSDCYAGDQNMAHASILFAINAIIYYSGIGNYDQCEREIDALVQDHPEKQSNSDLRALFHRLTGRIQHPERIKNLYKLTKYIESVF